MVRHVLGLVFDRPLNATREWQGPTYGNLVEYSTKLDELCDLFLQLNDYLWKTIRSTNSTELSPVEYRGFQVIQDTAPFLRDIATPRLAAMQARAKRGIQLLNETEKRQRELQDEIERTLQNGWVAPGGKWLSHRVIYYHLPDMKSMALQLSYARRWLQVESEEVYEVFQGREAEFFSLQREQPSNLSKKQVYQWWSWQAKIVWSRWSLEDRREDPQGKEAFCWDRGDPEFSDSLSQISIWQRMAGWLTFRDNGDLPSHCGDASRRNG